MPAVSYPGLYFTEEGGIPIVSSPSPDIAGFECLCKRGYTDRLGFVSSWGDFTRLYGGYENSTQNGEYFGPHAVKSYFDNGGGAAWIARVVNATDVQATLASFAALDLTAAWGTIVAVGLGEGGNDLSIGTVKAESTIGAVAWGNAVANVTVASVAGFEVGDFVYATDGTNQQGAVVYNIDIVTNELDIIATAGAVGAGGNVATGSPIYTTSTHRVQTTLAQATSVAGTTAVLTDASRVTVGMLIGINDGTANFCDTVTAVSGNTVTFGAGVGVIFAATTRVFSQEFDVRVYENDVLLETHSYLSTSATSPDYVETRFDWDAVTGSGGDDNESNLISWDALAAAAYVKNATDFCPAYMNNEALISGADTAAPTAAEWAGAALVGLKSGLRLFDNAGQLNFFALPDTGLPATDQAANTYAQTNRNGDCMYICHSYGGLIDDSMTEIYNHRVHTLGIDSSYSALYCPWIYVADPDISGHTLMIPPDGVVLGNYAEATRSRGVHKAPANIALNNVLGLQVDFTDEEQGQLNPVGVNCIRNFAERGFRIWGARTLWTVEDGRHYVNIRRTLIYIKTSILQDTGWVVFEPNNYDTRSRLYLSIRAFLNGLHRSGALYAPSGSDPESLKGAYFVKCDDENNPPSEIEQGKLNCDIGVRCTPPAEFVIFNLSLISGEVDVTGP